MHLYKKQKKKQKTKHVVMPVPLINTRGQASTTNAKWILDYAKHPTGEKLKINIALSTKKKKEKKIIYIYENHSATLVH